MNYPHSIPLCRTNGELLPAKDAISRVVLSSAGTKWSDVVVEQHRYPRSELADVMFKRHVVVINIGHSNTWECKKEGGLRATCRQEARFLLPERSAFFWSAESREGRVCECSRSGSGPRLHESRC